MPEDDPAIQLANDLHDLALGSFFAVASFILFRRVFKNARS